MEQHRRPGWATKSTILDHLHVLQGRLEPAEFEDPKPSTRSAADSKAKAERAVKRLQARCNRRKIQASEGDLKDIVEAYTRRRVGKLNPLEYRLQVNVTPAKAQSAFMKFSAAKYKKVKAENPGARDTSAMITLLGAAWKEASDDEKDIFVEAAAEDKARLRAALAGGEYRFEEKEIKMEPLYAPKAPFAQIPAWPKWGLGKLPDKKLHVSIVTTIIDRTPTPEPHCSTMALYRTDHCEYYIFLDPLGEGTKFADDRLRDKDIYTEQVRKICPRNATSVAECMDTMPYTVRGNIFGLRNWTVFYLEAMAARTHDQIVMWNQDGVNYGPGDSIWSALHMANCVLSQKQIFSQLPTSTLTFAPDLSLMETEFNMMNKLAALRSEDPLECYRSKSDDPKQVQLLLSSRVQREQFNWDNWHELGSQGKFLFTGTQYTSNRYDEDGQDGQEKMYVDGRWRPDPTAAQAAQAARGIPEN